MVGPFHKLSLLAVLGLPLLGCGGSSEASLGGKVTYNGEVVEAGSVTLTPEGSGTSAGAKMVAGNYTLEKATPGSYRAVIAAERVRNGPLTREEAAKEAGLPPANYIPANAEGNSKVVEVSGGQQTLDFAITGPARGK
jgi:hypothetical protein